MIKFKKIAAGFFVVTLSFGMVGCQEDVSSTLVNTENDINNSIDNSVNLNADTNRLNTEAITSSLKSLADAKTITVSEDLISINKSYSVEVDGEKVGSISGKFIKTTGDKFVLKDNAGNILSSEKQIKRWNVKLNRLAEVYDYNDNVVGYIGEEVIKDFFNVGYTFHFYDKDKNEIGVSKQKNFTLLDTFNVYNNNDSLCFEIKADFSLMNDKYTITVHDNSTIPSEQVVFLTAILHSIMDENKKQNK